VKRIVKELHRRDDGAQPAEDPVAAQVRRVAAQHAAGELAQEQLDAVAAEVKVTPAPTPAAAPAAPEGVTKDVNITAK
jgi:hypothetical protein